MKIGARTISPEHRRESEKVWVMVEQLFAQGRPRVQMARALGYWVTWSVVIGLRQRVTLPHWRIAMFWAVVRDGMGVADAYELYATPRQKEVHPFHHRTRRSRKTLKLPTIGAKIGPTAPARPTVSWRAVLMSAADLHDALEGAILGIPPELLGPEVRDLLAACKKFVALRHKL